MGLVIVHGVNNWAVILYYSYCKMHLCNKMRLDEHCITKFAKIVSGLIFASFKLSFFVNYGSV